MAISALALSSCKKDLSSDWEGTYNGTSSSGISRIIITSVDKSTVKLTLQTNLLGTYYDYATIGSGKLGSATSLTVDEDGTISGSSDTYHFQGTGTRNGNSLALTGQAVNKNNSSDVKSLVFAGNK